LAAVHLAPFERDHGEISTHQASGGIGEAECGKDRRLLGKAIDKGKTAVGLRQGSKARPRGIRSRLPETGDAEHDQARVDLREYVPAKTPLLQRARAEILDEDVGGLHEPLDNLHAERGAQIGCDRSLVTVQDLVIEPDTVLAVAPVARLVTRIRTLDLDDVGAEIRK